ncbi:MAG: hypothetical protein LAN64_05645 [Acidobacteriia bacterium]|nr:hypothetical protein [Terriglobia bacterium]
MELAIFIAAVAATLVIAAVVVRTTQIRRTRALARVAAERGFSFDEVAVPFTDDEMLSVLRFTQRRGVARNVMRGADGDKQLVAFDYRSPEGARETVVAFRAALPVFDLLTAIHGVNPNVMAPVFARLGMTVMRFDSHPEFCRNHLLIGPDEEALRKFFQPPLLDYFQSLDKARRWAVESSGAWLLICRAGYLAKPEQLRAYIEEAAMVAARLSAATPAAGAFTR